LGSLQKGKHRRGLNRTYELEGMLKKVPIIRKRPPLVEKKRERKKGGMGREKRKTVGFPE